jgi:hypothetical protein
MTRWTRRWRKYKDEAEMRSVRAKLRPAIQQLK